MPWLHLSDLHMGCRGEEVWWQVHSEFRDSLRRHFQPIDMILVTGDLTYSASPDQFELFDQFLDNLLGCQREAGQGADPLVIPVPGNHDLVWPEKKEIRTYRFLENFWKNPEDEDIAILRDELWQERNSSLFEPLFGNYTAWLEKRAFCRASRAVGMLPFAGRTSPAI